MSELKAATSGILVRLVRPGVGVRDYHLAPGATLSDLLRQSGATIAEQAIFIDGVAPEEALTLRDGAVISIVPRPRNSAGDEPWRAALPAFRDEAVFRDYTEALKDAREADDP